MDEKSPAMGQTVTFAKPNIFPMARWHMPSLPMAILLVTVGFLVLTPLGLMILNSFQIARPGEPIDWGMDGWAKACSSLHLFVLGHRLGASRRNRRGQGHVAQPGFPQSGCGPRRIFAHLGRQRAAYFFSYHRTYHGAGDSGHDDSRNHSVVGSV